MLARELKVPFVVSRNRHDRAGAVLHQYIRSDETGDLLAVDRIHRRNTESNTFLGVGLFSHREGSRANLVYQWFDLIPGSRLFGQLLHQRMFDGENEERNSPQG